MVARAKVVRWDGVVVLEGPKYLVRDLVGALNTRYPGMYQVEEEGVV